MCNWINKMIGNLVSMINFHWILLHFYVFKNLFEWLLSKIIVKIFMKNYILNNYDRFLCYFDTEFYELSSNCKKQWKYSGDANFSINKKHIFLKKTSKTTLCIKILSLLFIHPNNRINSNAITKWWNRWF